LALKALQVLYTRQTKEISSLLNPGTSRGTLLKNQRLQKAFFFDTLGSSSIIAATGFEPVIMDYDSIALGHLSYAAINIFQYNRADVLFKV
jgi:hypothetical protein